MLKLASFLLILLSAPSWALNLEQATDLKRLGQDHPNDVIVLMLSQPGCSYCVVVKEDYLEPLLKSSDAPPIQVLELSTNHRLIGFEGKEVSAEDLSSQLDAHFTPTLLFVDAQGNSLHPPIVGLSTPEFYGYYLDEAIRIAREQLP